MGCNAEVSDYYALCRSSLAARMRRRTHRPRDTDVTEDVIEEVEIIEVTAMPDPGNLVEYRGEDGEELFFMVTGDDMGSVWGTDLYTDDSQLAAAAVHAGVLENGESGFVMVTILPGEEAYEGSLQNGVDSWDYGPWSGSYMVDFIPENVEVEIGALPDPGNLIEYRGRNGEVFEFEVTGDATGSVWGTDVYTDDSRPGSSSSSRRCSRRRRDRNCNGGDHAR